MRKDQTWQAPASQKAGDGHGARTRKYCIPQPDRVRRIEQSFAWIDHRLLRHGFLEVMTHQDQALYLFLVLAADRHGVSFYRKEKISDSLGLDWGAFEVARDRLIDLMLVAFQPYSAATPNGYYQVLPVDRRPRNFEQETLQRLRRGSAKREDRDPVAWARS